MKDWKTYVVSVVVLIAMAVGIHLTQEFRFYDIESNDLFLFDWSDICAKLCRPGGLALVMASFLTQFMKFPLAGTLIVSVLYVLAALMVGRISRTDKGSPLVSGLAFIPAAFLYLCLESSYYRFYGHVSFILALCMSVLYVSIPKERWRFRLAAGIVMTPLLYHLAGSAAVVFAVSAFVREIVDCGWKGLRAVAYPAVLLLAAYIYVSGSYADSWETAMTPLMYYSTPSTYFFPIYAWVSVPLIIAFSWLLSRAEHRMKSSVIWFLAGVAVSFFIAGNLYGKVHSRSSYRIAQERYWAENGEWDKIISTADRRQPTYLVSYLNLALAHKGQLLQNYRYYNPQPVSVIMYPNPNLKAGLTLQSNVYLAWGYLAAARQAAFDANQVTAGFCNPQMLKVLIQTNRALGAHEVALKYEKILDKTLFHRGDVEGLEVPLPAVDEYVRHDGLVGDMRDILDADPTNSIISQFYELYMILERSKD